ncbi:MAG: hypothetical protein HQK99_17585 [Nitrospirae bacterium]|nr:hypothetical protein [Nitrospirota bacterium]MBF0477360.1 hypothetical protein [Deltaproteobacteria bacterium]
MTNVDVQLLGEQMKRMQAELRDLRGVRTDVAHLRAEISDRHEGLSERIDNLERAIDARFEQMHQTMAMNLAVVLDAIKGR